MKEGNKALFAFLFKPRWSNTLRGFYMFTGLIKTIGYIEEKDKESLRISVPDKFISKLKLGASVAVNGACLTVVSANENIFSADILSETWKRTMFSDFKKGSVVNIEFPVGSASFHGHVVQGHVDGTAKLLFTSKKGTSRTLTFAASNDILKYVVLKGSIAINGISLTIISVTPKQFSVGIIPHTWETTNLSYLKKGDKMNIEVDVLAKYAEKLNQK